MMPGMNVYDMNPPRQKDNPFGNQSAMPQKMMATPGTMTVSSLVPQDPQTRPGLLASQMRPLAPMAGMPNAMQMQNATNAMQVPPSMQRQPQQGRQANQPSAMTTQPTTY